ncbi:hypothetical protein C8R43DRAFT_1155066 [Mycena crocata]|nr:hypothetical protein C8R43DRAFT_1155066 [Mycena crocata]
MLCLLDLNLDVLLHIFTYLDVASVLRWARVSSTCNRLAHSKHVWLAILLDLGSRRIVDLPQWEAFQCFSTTQLIEEVKRAAFGPRTWAANSSSPPTVRRQIHASMSELESCPPSEPTLLSGDKHLLVKRGTGCEIWDIVEGRRIWARDGILRSQVAAQTVHDGAELLIVVCTGQAPILTIDPALLNCQIVVQVSLIDLKSNSVKRLPPLKLPRTCAVFSDVVMADDIWAANVGWLLQNGDGHKGLLLVNWREEKFVLLDCKVGLKHKKMLGSHMLALTNAGATSEVVLYPSASFDPYWQPLHSMVLAKAANDPVRLQPVILQQVEYPFLPGSRTPFMSVHKCLLHRGSYLVSTHTASISSLPPDSEESRRPAVHRYRLTLPTSALLTWERISCAGTINCVFINSFTYAGYGMSFPARLRRPVPRLICHPATGDNTVDGTWTVPIPEENPGCASLSPQTGALTICSVHGADVYYYE